MTKPGRRVRADQRLVELGLVADAKEAAARILAGEVFEIAGAGERRIDKAGEALRPDSALRLEQREHPYVSRGGLKLARALDHFAIDPSGLICADIGVSTGGFSDCLLQRGAARVHAVDVGYGQVAWRIRGDPRVRLYERTNARHLTPELFQEAVELMVIDVSFIGLAQLLPALVPLLALQARVVALVKPQFELPASEVPPGGVIRDPAARARAVQGVRQAAESAGLTAEGEVESPIAGAEGNVEILIVLRADRPPRG
jgi:23S rRNA (cytidine1920-2'-O)/16S rRNA (cytidine1409-2'-O)-methyltransferase